MSENKYVIVKYADERRNVSAYLEDSVYGSYSANECGITKKTYKDIPEATPDLIKLREFNPSVSYGIAKVK